MAGPIHIRTLRGDYLAAVLAVWNRTLTRNPISEDRFVRIVLGDPDYRPGDDSGFLVATQNDEPIGFVRAIIRYWPNDRLGLEPDVGWIPYFAVDPAHQRTGVGSLLLQSALDFFRRHGRKRVWVCGTTTSAPGSLMPGVDEEAYPAARPLLEEHGFVVDQYGFSMARSIVDFDVEEHRRAAWESGPDIVVSTLAPDRVDDFLTFVADALPGAWCLAGRAKVQSGRLHEILIATLDGRIVGYCQWDGEHFGPFGVSPAARNRKVGAKMFTEAVQRIRESDGRTVWFNWADENAKRFYDRFAFAVTRRFTILRRDAAKP